MIHYTVTHTECVINPLTLFKKCHWPAKTLETKLHNWNPMSCSKKTDLKKSLERWALAGPPTASKECKETQAEIPALGR